VNAWIERLQTDGEVLCWTASAADHPHWAVHADERRQVEARWMRRGGHVRCRWRRDGTDVTWETLHDLHWLRLALVTVDTPRWRRRGTIRVG
jgi:hypothetical protein